MKLIASIVAGILLYFIGYYIVETPWRVHLALPVSKWASLDENYDVSGPQPDDYGHCLHARVSPEQFQAFAHKLGLVESPGRTPYSSFCNASWWKQPGAAQVYWFNPKSDSGTVAAPTADNATAASAQRTFEEFAFYMDGNLYYAAQKW